MKTVYFLSHPLLSEGHPVPAWFFNQAVLILLHCHIKRDKNLLWPLELMRLWSYLNFLLMKQHLEREVQVQVSLCSKAMFYNLVGKLRYVIDVFLNLRISYFQLLHSASSSG